MGWLAFLGRYLLPVIQALWPVIRDALATRQEHVEVRDAVVVVRPERTDVVAGPSSRLDDIRRRYRLPVLLVGLLALSACATREVERVEVVPVIIDAGPALPNGAKVATSDPVLVVVFGPDGAPVAGAGAAPVNLSGAVVVPEWRWRELVGAEKALGGLMPGLTPEEFEGVMEALGRRQ